MHNTTICLHEDTTDRFNDDYLGHWIECNECFGHFTAEMEPVK